MRLLAVDDELYVLKNIRRTIECSQLGILQVFTALSAEQARGILQNEEIDLLLCDIEMPQESGLELLLWVNKHHPEIASIVLTCHADFEYIRNAMRLDVVDYLIKPVPAEELEAAIQKAIEAKKAMEELKTTSSYGKYWEGHKSKLLETFWSDVLHGHIQMTDDALLSEASKRNLDLASVREYLPILLHIFSKPASGRLKDTLENEVAIKNIAQTALSNRLTGTVVVEIAANTLLCLIPIFNGENTDVILTTASEECETLVNSAETFLPNRLFCYIGNPCAMTMVLEAREHLSEYAENDITKRKRVVQLNNGASWTSTAALPNMNILAVLLMEGAYGRAKQETIDLLQIEHVDKGYLHSFYQAFLQMLSPVLEHHNLSFSKLLRENETNYLPSFDSLQGIQEWALTLIDRLAESKGDSTVIIEVKRYIDNHLDGKLSRETLAKHVYLHPDYLNRIFKQEQGVTLYEYITERRIELAKELLIKTELKASVISLNIGYSNFSQFSKLFHSRTGMSPKEYRRRNKVKGSK